MIGAASGSPAARRLGLLFAADPKDFLNAGVVRFLRHLLGHLRSKVIVVCDRGSSHKGPLIWVFLAWSKRLRRPDPAWVAPTKSFEERIDFASEGANLEVWITSHTLGLRFVSYLLSRPPLISITHLLLAE